jgi:hypothetical protein
MKAGWKPQLKQRLAIPDHMANLLIGRRTLNEFREYLVSGSTLHGIREEFEAADVPWRDEEIRNVQGDRRTLVEQFYRGLDLTRVADARKLISVFENVLWKLQHQRDSEYGEEVRESAKRNLDNLTGWLRRDSFFYDDRTGRLSSDRLKEEAPGFDFQNPEPLLTTLARLCAQEGKAREVAVIAHGKASIRQTGGEQAWNGDYVSFFTLFIDVPHILFGQLGDKREEVENNLLEKCQLLMRQHPLDEMRGVQISLEVSTDPKWREKAQAWVAGKNVSNQGRVRSDNIASRSYDGLLFRSQPEIYLYQALKALGVSFAPLPVFVRGGEAYRRIEPDFVLLKDGVLMIVEVDGDTVHEDTPAEAHDRTTMLLHEGAFVERVKASDCDTAEKARVCAQKLVQVLGKRKAAK